jgi:hypothetical protein
MRKALVLVAVCVLAAVFAGCSSAPQSLDRSKDYPLAITGSIIVPAILEADTILKPASGMVYIGLKVMMENRASKVASLGSSEFNLILDGQPYRCAPAILTAIDPRFDGQDFGTTAIQPRQSREGWMVFEVPPGIKMAINAELRFTDSALIGGGHFSRTTFDPSAARKCETAPERFSLEAKDVAVTYKFTDYNIEEKVAPIGTLYAIADMVVTNNARIKSRFSTDDLRIFTTQGSDFETSRAAVPPDQLESKEIPAGRNARGSILFELPDDDCDVRKVALEYSSAEVYSYLVPHTRVETIINSPPTARMDVPDKGFINTDITFNGTNSSDPNGDISGYEWDFGETGTTADTSALPVATYKYTKTGKYTVTLKVRDVGGLTSQATRPIEIAHYFSLVALGYGTETNQSSNHTGAFFVDIKMTNIANQTKQVTQSDFQLRTLDGTLYDWIGDDGKAPRTLGAGATAKWRVYFTIPADKGPSRIIYEDIVTADI